MPGALSEGSRYAKFGDVHIAYQIVGDGPMDIIFAPGLFSHLDHQWEKGR